MLKVKKETKYLFCKKYYKLLKKILQITTKKLYKNNLKFILYTYIKY